MSNYSNTRAMGALIKASLLSIFKNPSAIVFSIVFPMIFILVFGFLGGSKSFSINVAMDPKSDTTTQLYKALHQVPSLSWEKYADTTALHQAIKDADVAAVISIIQQPAGMSPKYTLVLDVPSSAMGRMPQLQSILKAVVQHMDPEIEKRTEELAKIDVHISQTRDFKTIDFILPGQLGFSLLASGVFGTAFVFFNLRQTLVIKRFFATPVRREIIIISEGIARVLFQIVGAIIIISIGHYAFGYTLIHGWVTFLEMLALCALALMIFMGFGFVISGVAKSEASIPPFSNLITLPQFLLAGTFFPIDNFPKWLQPICRVLPLTYLNDALRKVAFDGVGLWDVRMDVLVLLIWGTVVYITAAKVFRWE
jgi:ABC-2 type transport system permease protein